MVSWSTRNPEELRDTEGIQDANGRRSDPKDDAAARAFLAVQLHNYYTAMEKVLERILRVVDGVIPTGDSWHRELLAPRKEPLGTRSI